MSKYPFETIEPKWQKYWDAHKTFAAVEDAAFPKEKRAFVLDMFPYPSSQGLHVGHPEGYTATDIYCRYLRAAGFNVLHPMGFDAFGLPAENYAIKTGQHPAKTTAANINHFREQIKRLGFSYDWDREVDTSSEEYYRWTQWIFLKLFEKGLAYEAESPINWCPSCKTGLANEEVKDGQCERCHTKVTRKRIRQWILRITSYAERLLADLDALDWPEPVKLMQRNWIGRSEGATVRFAVWEEGTMGKEEGTMGRRDDGKKGKTRNDSEVCFPSSRTTLSNQNPLVPPSLHPSVPPSSQSPFIEVYTTRPDTLFGATYMVLAPEHPLVGEITRPEQKEAVEGYIKKAAGKSDLERTDLAKTKTGVFTGAYAINPVNNEKIPIWIADYVLISYGSGAIMAVPAHDERDWEFANVFGLPVVQVVEKRRDDGTKGRRDEGEEGEGYADVQRPYGMAGSNGSCGDNIHSDENFSEGRNVRTNKPDAESSGIGGSEYSGGEWEKKSAGVSSFSINSSRLVDGVGNSCTHISKDTVFNRSTNKSSVGQDREHGKTTATTPEITHVTSSIPLEEETKGQKDVMNESPSIPPSLHPSVPSSCTSAYGYAVNSGFLNGLPTDEAKKRITAWLEEKGIGKKAVNYKLRDWVFSRQRYWGEPIPLVHCEKCGVVPVPESELPLRLPQVKSYEPSGTGESPLANIPDWVNTKCPKCGGPAKRETNTMPQWAGSCWYYLRYLDPHNTSAFASPEKIAYWAPVDLYVGGTEHAVLHLLYSRFWHKVLFDLGLVNTAEPFLRLINQGMILGEDNQKMSKSAGNVINPDDIIASYGADAMRVYEMFMGPLEVSKPWITAGLAGVTRFLERLWSIGEKISGGENPPRSSPASGSSATPPAGGHPPATPPDAGTRDSHLKSNDDNTKANSAISKNLQSPVPSPQSLIRLLHKTIKKVTADTASLNFNTAISAMMVYSAELAKFVDKEVKEREEGKKGRREAMNESPSVPPSTNSSPQSPVPSLQSLASLWEPLVIMSAAYAPHLGEELWEKLGHKESVLKAPWPQYQEALTADDEVTIVIQVNGKNRDKFTAANDASKADLEKTALSSDVIKKWLQGKEVVKTIIVPNKLVNIVVKG